MFYQQYATLGRLKQHRNIQSSADDDFLLWLLRSASAMIQDFTCRSFIPYYAEKTATMKHTYDHSRLIAPDDVVHLSAVSDGAGEIVPDWTVIDGVWVDNPRGWYFPNVHSQARLTGLWGYHDQPANMWKQVEQLSGDLSSTDTVFNVLTADAYQMGDVLRIGDELLLVEQVIQQTAPLIDRLAVARGINGSQADEHLIGTPVFVYQPVTAIQWACVEIAAWLYKNRDRVNEYVQFGARGGAKIEDMSADIWHLLAGYRRGDCGGC
jgi:hypothetical protein